MVTLSSAIFPNRTAAGGQLGAELAGRHYPEPIILALPRGGVPVALEVARALHAPLDLVMVKKLGAPGHAEFAIGAIVDGDQPSTIINSPAAAMTGASEAYIDQAKSRALEEIARQRSLYGASDTLKLHDKTAIVVDDGIATGSTILAAAKAVRQSGAARIVLAVPVASQGAIDRISPHVDEVVCLHIPRNFHSVGVHYDNFDQTSDDEVIDMLAEARSLHTDQRS